ncbi:MAG: hypothetical protein BWX72_00877 [Firmicutes bacterium ADurb.Bin080]|jgi:ribosomal protein S18 acetylase RimI-like enzyme|nr:GNAT family N-acetyltransferase [Clostridiales bacterium]OQC15734.1 MAG: hypothetical protein BWX72_00877 [Firmicutes bacterium ADurb.Bin080]
MLSVAGTNDKNILDRLSLEIFGKKFDGGVGYVLCESGTEIGIAKLKVNPENSAINSIGILPSYRKKGYGDFFTRALLNVLSGVSEYITIDYSEDYFLQFGFMNSEKGMIIKSSDIVFPHKCGH